MSDVSNSHDLAPNSFDPKVMSEAEASLREIDEAAHMAFQSENDEHNLTSGATSAAASTGQAAQVHVDFSKLTEDQKQDRIKVFTKRAASQRGKGRAELEKAYAGAMSVAMKLSWNDLTVASSCERFLGMCDLAPYTIGRRGPSVLGSKATATVLEKFSALVEKYYEAGMLAKHSGQTLFETERAQVFAEEDWVTPEYTTAAFEMTIHAKYRGTTRLVAGMTAWDEAIRLANVLEWNGKIDTSKIADLREQERKAINAVHLFARRSLIGLYNGTLKVEAAKAPKEIATTAQAASDDATEELAAVA